MKNRFITAAAFAACLALCAAVWPQKQPAGETPALPTPAAVIATQPEVPEIAEMEEVIPPEEKKRKQHCWNWSRKLTLPRSHRLLKRPQRVKYQSRLNRMPHPHKNLNLPRLHLTSNRTTWSMCRDSDG